MNKTKEEILWKCMSEFAYGINETTAHKAMQLYADQCVKDRDVEILEWIEKNINSNEPSELDDNDTVLHLYSKIEAFEDIKQFIKPKIHE